MYSVIVYNTTIREVEDFIEDYFMNANGIFNNIDMSEVRGSDVMIESDYDTIEDLGYGLDSEGFEVNSNILPF